MLFVTSYAEGDCHFMARLLAENRFFHLLTISDRRSVLVKDGIFEIIAAVFAVLEEKQVIGWFLSLFLVWVFFMLVA